MANITDPNFEYDAPTYVDFEEHNFDGSDSADEWFDNHFEEEGAGSLAQVFGFEDSFIPATEDTTTQPSTTSTTIVTDTEVKQEVVSEEPTSSGITAKFYDVMKNLDADKKPSKKSLSKAKEIQSLKSPKGLKTDTPDNQTSHTPGVLKRYLKKRKSTRQSVHQQKSTEDLELEEIHRLQREAREKLKQSRRSFRMLAKSSKPLPLKGSKPTTIAKEFNFRTKDRERSQPWTGLRHTEVMPSQFATTLRRNREESNMLEATKVKPFKFQLDSRVKDKLARGPIRGEMIPTAEAVAKYQTTTPPRFHTTKTRKRHASDSSHCSGGSSRKNTSYDLTVPKTPHLVSHKRARPVTAKSTTQVEDEELARIRGHQFKARPINPEIFSRGGMYGVKQITDGGVTESKTPELATKRRQEQRRARELEERGEEEEDGDSETFHAKPMPNFERIQGLPKKRPYLPIVPQSPAMQLKRRCLHSSHTHDIDEDVDVETHVIKANPVPSFDKVFEPQLPHKATEMKPFVFDIRDKDKPSKETLVQMIMRKVNTKKPEFRAQPLPDFTSYTLPKKVPLQGTNVQPFNLHTETRGEQYVSKWEEKVAAENDQLKRDAEFKAKDASSLYTKPFQPAKSVKPLTDRGNIVLHSDLRYQERAKYESERAQRDMEKEQENLQRQAQLEAREAKELTAYRRDLVHKAYSIQHYAPFVIKPSSKPFTVPCSPYLSTRARLRGQTLQTDV